MVVAISLGLAIVALAVAIVALACTLKLSTALAERKPPGQPETALALPEPANDAKWAEFEALHREKFERALVGVDDVVGTSDRVGSEPHRQGH